MDVNEKKNKIIEIIKQRGPCLPVHIATRTELSVLLASALLSEMVSNKILKVSNLKVGGSPLYFLAGQEALLENFYTYLPSKEKEAFSLIKKNGILEDVKLQPAFRVAMRSVKDFAIPLFLNIQDVEKLFWYFHSIPKEKVMEKIKSSFLKEKREKREERKEEKKERLIEKPKVAETDFAKKVYDYLSKENVRVVLEEEKKRRSIILKILVESSLGDIEMLAVAKDKRTISESDIRLLINHSQNRRLPILLLCNGKPSKKALQEIENFKSLLFLKRLD